MTQISVQPMEWSKTADIEDVEPFSGKDAECFREIRDVLKKYDALERFGITLIHSHFTIGEDEEMVEFTDHENRTLITRPVNRSQIDDRQVTVTNWKLMDGDVVAMRVCSCARTNQGHSGGHVAV
jgi:hypothetical protein